MEMFFFDSNIRTPRRVVAITLLFLLSLALPCRTIAQSFNPLISFEIESCTLDEALEKLFADYELNVAFSKAELSKIRIESYACSYKSVEDVLADLLKGTDYGFKRIGKQYVIRKNQQLANEQEAIPAPSIDPQTETVVSKHDTVISKTGDTVRIFDTLKIIRTVMRHDTIVEVRHEITTDTVYSVEYRGLQIAWPKFKNNGWFVTPFVYTGSMQFQHIGLNPDVLNGTMDVAPSFNYGIGLDGGYKYKRFDAGITLDYQSVRHRFLLDQTVSDGGYYVNDTLDIYYVVHSLGDTTFQYILDSTYVPLTTTHYAYRDVNQLDYLSIGGFASIDFVKREHFRAFVKAGFSISFLVNRKGSLYSNESPFHASIDKKQVEPIRLSYYGGLGLALKVAHRIELVPEMHYRMTQGSLYRVDYPFDIKMRVWDFRLGLTYYF